MEEHFSLRWNNFHKNLSSGFLNHLMEDTLVDVTLAADGKFLQAHRLVLSVCSPYFKQLFAIDPCKHPIVILKDVQYKQLSDILTFMYQGEVNVREEDLADFLKTAELLQIRGLTEKNNQSEDTTCVPMQEISNAHLSSAEFDEDNEVQEIDSPTPLEIINKKDIVCSVEKPSPRETIVDDDIESALPQKRLCWDSSPSAMPQSSNTENIKSVFRSVLTKEEPPDTLQESYSHSSTACPQGHFLQDLQNQRSLTLNTDSSIPNGNQPVETSQQLSQVNVAGSQEETAHAVSDDTTELSSTQFISTCRGQMQLVHHGFRYHVDRRSGTRTFWRCALYRQGCRSRCVTIGHQYMRHTQPIHNHHGLSRSKDTFA